jgi:hypothetical protein
MTIAWTVSNINKKTLYNSDYSLNDFKNFTDDLITLPNTTVASGIFSTSTVSGTNSKWSSLGITQSSSNQFSTFSSLDTSATTESSTTTDNSTSSANNATGSTTTTENTLPDGYISGTLAYDFFKIYPTNSTYRSTAAVYPTGHIPQPTTTISVDMYGNIYLCDPNNGPDYFYPLYRWTDEYGVIQYTWFKTTPYDGNEHTMWGITGLYVSSSFSKSQPNIFVYGISTVSDNGRHRLFARYIPPKGSDESYFDGYSPKNSNINIYYSTDGVFKIYYTATGVDAGRYDWVNDTGNPLLITAIPEEIENEGPEITLLQFTAKGTTEPIIKTIPESTMIGYCGTASIIIDNIVYYYQAHDDEIYYVGNNGSVYKEEVVTVNDIDGAYKVTGITSYTSYDSNYKIIQSDLFVAYNNGTENYVVYQLRQTDSLTFKIITKIYGWGGYDEKVYGNYQFKKIIIFG